MRCTDGGVQPGWSVLQSGVRLTPTQACPQACQQAAAAGRKCDTRRPPPPAPPAFQMGRAPRCGRAGGGGRWGAGLRLCSTAATCKHRLRPGTSQATAGVAGSQQAHRGKSGKPEARNPSDAGAAQLPPRPAGLLRDTHLRAPRMTVRLRAMLCSCRLAALSMLCRTVTSGRARTALLPGALPGAARASPICCSSCATVVPGEPACCGTGVQRRSCFVR